MRNKKNKSEFLSNRTNVFVVPNSVDYAATDFPFKASMRLKKIFQITEDLTLPVCSEKNNSNEEFSLEMDIMIFNVFDTSAKTR